MQANYDIVNYFTFTCPFESGKWAEEGKKLQKCEYLENEKSFLDEMNSFYIAFEGLPFGEKRKNSGNKLYLI